MSFFRQIADFFESLFMGASPEVRIKQELKKIETDLRTHVPQVYKNGLLQPNVAEAFRQLYIHTKPIDDILSNTLCSDDIQRNARFTDILIETGLTGDKRELRKSLTYEERKAEVFPSPNPQKVFELQHRNLEKLLREMSGVEFSQINTVFAQLDNLADICRFNYVSAIQPFDPSFQPGTPDAPTNFSPIPPDTLDHVFQDFYYVAANFKATTSTARAIITLAEQQHGISLSERESTEIISHLKKIITIIHKVLDPQTIVSFLSLAKRTPVTAMQIQTAIYDRKTIANYCERLKKQYIADEERIKVEQQDDTILSEISKLFNGHTLESLQGYNTELNNILQDNVSLSFTWIIPLQILKTFFTVYFNESIKSLLNALVIEGFFDNPSNKSEFSSNVYYCNETSSRIESFETSFTKGGEFDAALISGYIRDSHKDADFIKKLSVLIKNINSKAKALIQSEMTQFFSLTQKISIILMESKKPTAEYITNVKMLFSSARSKEAADTLETEFPYWKIFLEIMKNYAIIGDIEKQVS